MGGAAWLPTSMRRRREKRDSCSTGCARAMLGSSPIARLAARPDNPPYQRLLRGAAGLFVSAAATSSHKTNLFVEHGVQTMIRPRCTTLGVRMFVVYVHRSRRAAGCRRGGDGTTIACVSVVCVILCIVHSGGEVHSLLELVAVMRHSVEV